MGAPRPSCWLVFPVLAVCLAPLGWAGPLPDACKPPAGVAKGLQNGPSAKVYDAVGAWFADSGDMKCALLAFKEAVRLEPGSVEAHFDLGVAYLRLNEFPAAAGEFRTVLKANPGMVLARVSLGSALSDMGKPAEAEAEFREALKTEPKSVPALDHLAQLLASQRRYDAAIRYWNQALALQPGAPDLLLSLAATIYEGAGAKEAAGVLGARTNGTKEAIRILTELTRRNPDMKAAHFTLGNIFASEARFREAADEYAQVARLDPKDTVALLASSKALATVSAFQEALTPAQAYIQLKPDDPEGHLLLGAVYRGLGDYPKAEVELAHAVSGSFSRRPQRVR